MARGSGTVGFENAPPTHTHMAPCFPPILQTPEAVCAKLILPRTALPVCKKVMVCLLPACSLLPLFLPGPLQHLTHPDYISSRLLIILYQPVSPALVAQPPGEAFQLPVCHWKIPWPGHFPLEVRADLSKPEHFFLITLIPVC